MANSTPADKTFRLYTKEQSDAYARTRPRYHDALAEFIVKHHTDNGGQLGSLVDVGCGPGTATLLFAGHFDSAVGLDPSDAMVDTARNMGGLTRLGHPVRFEVSTAEKLGSDVPEPKLVNGTVDLIIAATAAHWFDMSRFWPRAAELLRPGGSVAIFTSQVSGVHESVPNAAAISQVTADVETQLEPYVEPGNRMNLDLYKDLVLPWQMPQPVDSFPEADFLRKEWDSNNDSVENNNFLNMKQPDLSLDAMEMGMATLSPVTRWRQAHPELAGTDQDVAKAARVKIQKLLHEAGVEPGKEWVRFRTTAVLLMFTKRA